MAKITHTFSNLLNSATYYGKVFSVNPRGRINNRIDLSIFTAITTGVSRFPEEPSEYVLIDTYTSAQTWTAPEDGWFQVEVFGASGNGGKGVAKRVEEDNGESYDYYANGGGGGGGGAYAASVVKLKKDNTITFASLGIGGVATVNFNSSVNAYPTITVESGKNGGSGHTYSGGGNSSYIAPSGGKGGTASGGNVTNINGSNGGKGTVADGVDVRSDVVTTGGAGGKPGHTDGRTGGKGGYFSGYSNEIAPTNGKAGFVRISRGNTNALFPEYLAFNADMVFDTGIYCTQNTTIDISFTNENDSANYLYGARTSDNSASVTAYLSQSGAWRFGNAYRNFTTRKSTDIHTVVVSKTGIVYDGTAYNFINTLKNFTCPWTLVLGSARTTSGAKAAATFIGKIYHFRMYDSGTLILDWVPCVKPDGTRGFYDNVTGTFVSPM